MAEKYRIERTKKVVPTITGFNIGTTMADVTIVWDDGERIGLELPPFEDVVIADIEQRNNLLSTLEGRKYVNEVVRGIINHIIQNRIYEQNNSNSEP